MNTTMEWYQNLQKPFFAPPSFLFGIVWGILYPIIFLSFSYVFYLGIKKEIPYVVLIPFGINLLANLAFSPIQFGLQNNLLAAIDITVVLATIIWGALAIYPYYRFLAFIQIPYFLWVFFATILQYSITWLNK